MNHSIFVSIFVILAAISAYLDEKCFRALVVMALCTIAINVSVIAWKQK